MATRTISNAGGNWNANGTWVEGAVPTSADDVVATATSGNVTINATANAKTLNLTNYVGTLTHNTGITLTVAGNVTFVAGMTYTASGTATITMNAGTAFAGAGKSFRNVNLTTASGGVTLSGANTFVNLTRSATAMGSVTVTSDQLVTGTLTVTGAARNLPVIVIGSGARRMITAAVTSLTNAWFSNAAGAGAAAPFIGTAIGDAAGQFGNSGITFATATTRFWVGNGGNWSDAANHWAATSGGAPGVANHPLPQDTARFNASSFSSAAQTVTMDQQYIAGSDWTGVTNTPTWNVGFNFGNILGSVTLVAGMNVTGTNANLIFGCGGTTFTSAGKTWPMVFWVLIESGTTLTLADNLTCSTFIRAGSGTIDMSGRTVTATVFFFGVDSASGANVTNATLNATGTGTVWNPGAMTLTGLTSAMINLTDTSATAKTFAGADKTYGTVTLTTGGSGSVTFTGSNTFTKLAKSGGGTKTVVFTTGTTTTLTGGTDAFFSGTSGNLITIQSSAAGSAFTVSKPSGDVISDHLSLKDSAATGGAVWFAGSNSTNVSGNTGWSFSTPVPKAGGGASSGIGGGPAVATTARAGGAIVGSSSSGPRTLSRQASGGALSSGIGGGELLAAATRGGGGVMTPAAAGGRAAGVVKGAGAVCGAVGGGAVSTSSSRSGGAQAAGEAGAERNLARSALGGAVAGVTAGGTRVGTSARSGGAVAVGQAAAARAELVELLGGGIAAGSPGGAIDELVARDGGGIAAGAGGGVRAVRRARDGGAVLAASSGGTLLRQESRFGGAIAAALAGGQPEHYVVPVLGEDRNADVKAHRAVADAVRHAAEADLEPHRARADVREHLALADVS